MGTADFWNGLATGALSNAGSLLQLMQPLIVIFVGVGAFGLVVYIIRRLAG